MSPERLLVLAARVKDASEDPESWYEENGLLTFDEPVQATAMPPGYAPAFTPQHHCYD